MGVNKAQIEVLDLTGLKCPMPALYARRALERAAPGALLAVLSDDPMAAVDVPHMCTTEGYEVVSSVREGTNLRLVLRRPA
jgi:tRNA 2-thiouridine synthesizing protein A